MPRDSGSIACVDDGKTFSFVPDMNLGAYDCLTLFAELVSGPGGGDAAGIYVYGAEWFVEWPNVLLRSITSFDDTKNEELTGYAEYWEVITIGSSAGDCCGAVRFDLDTYFATTSSWLFDWGQTTIRVGLELGASLGVRASLTIDAGGLKSFCFGINVAW